MNVKLPKKRFLIFGIIFSVFAFVGLIAVILCFCLPVPNEQNTSVHTATVTRLENWVEGYEGSFVAIYTEEYGGSLQYIFHEEGNSDLLYDLQAGDEITFRAMDFVGNAETYDDGELVPIYIVSLECDGNVILSMDAVAESLSHTYNGFRTIGAVFMAVTGGISAIFYVIYFRRKAAYKKSFGQAHP